MARLYPMILGPRSDEMAPLLREVHEHATRLIGTVTVTRGSPLGRMLAELAGLPRECSDAPCLVHFEQQPQWRAGTERWVRDMAGRRFVSRLSPAGEGEFEESFGWYHFRFALELDNGAVTFRLRRWSVFGVPIPIRLLPRVQTRERQQGEFYTFLVQVHLPWVGLLIGYQGRLRIEA